MSSSLSVLDTVDARTKLAGSNKMEILLFSLGTGEIFGINVFKVREVCPSPKITKAPNMPQGVRGVISLRGNVIPVVALAEAIGLRRVAEEACGTMIVTEYSRHVQGFLVQGVDRIVRMDWDQIKPPQAMLAGEKPVVTAVADLPDGRLVSILDMEQILADVIGIVAVPPMAVVEGASEQTVFFADDSAVARKEIVMVLDSLGVKYQQAGNGQEAWNKLQGMANRAQQDGGALRDQLSAVLVDVEMPEMDGYVLTGKIKSDPRFKGIPVIMHSSLSAEANRDMGKQAGVDAYVAKFDPENLADALRPFMRGQRAE